MGKSRLVFFSVVRFFRKIYFWQFARYGMLWAIAFLLVVNFSAFATLGQSLNISDRGLAIEDRNSNLQQLLQQSRNLFTAGKFSEAARVATQAADGFDASGNMLGKAIALNLISLAKGELGEWQAATAAIEQSLQILRRNENQKDRSERVVKITLAQNLNSLGQLQLSRGQAEAALITWQEATHIYQQLEDEIGIVGSLINQSYAFQSLGLYKRELEVLKQVEASLEKQPNSLLKAEVLRSLGGAWRRVGEIEKSQQVLQQSLQISEELRSPQAMGESLMALGNLARVNQNNETAIAFYDRVANLSVSSLTKIQAQLNKLSLFLDELRLNSARQLWPQIQAQFGELPASRSAVYAQINLAESLLRLRQETAKDAADWPEIAKILVAAIKQAKSLGDNRSEAYALGELGSLYEVNNQLAEARSLTDEALVMAQSLNADDIAYKWQWQLGRILKAQGKTEAAIAAYTEAVNILQSLRSDLIGINTDIQFSFRKAVEPVYRQLISLLLANPDRTQPTTENLTKALELMEALQLAELDNFFGDTCSRLASGADAVKIDRIDPTAAVIYTIILADRLEVILSLPGQPLQRYFTTVSKGKLESVVAQLRQSIIEPRRNITFNTGKLLGFSQQIYDWLMRPLESELIKQNIKKLVFIPDGVLRNIPMSVLHDGQQYLLEKYAIAINTGMRLQQPKSLNIRNLKIFSGGLTEARQGFPALPGVAEELKQIELEIPTVVMLNQKFTTQAITEKLESSSFPVVHLATHGEFSSSAEKTFILTWDGRLNINQFENLLKRRERIGSEAIELLVFSACQTAQGDDRAALGLAGMALRSGARSILATLWSVNDEATSTVMSQFYRELVTNKVSKIEAIRLAQLNLLNQRDFQHPLFWAPYILIGNWL